MLLFLLFLYPSFKALYGKYVVSFDIFSGVTEVRPSLFNIAQKGLLYLLFKPCLVKGIIKREPFDFCGLGGPA